MLGVLDAQFKSRSDPDALIRNFMRNNYTAKIISSEMAERQVVVDPRKAIEKQITNEITLDDLDHDWDNLLDGKVKAGLKIIDYFTRVERLETKGRKGINFYDFLKEPNLSLCQQTFLLRLKAEDPNSNEVKRMWQLFKFGHSSISAFPPSQMINALEKYKVNVILDPTMGWGGRLLGACALGAKQYIGIDSNTDLILPYHNLKTFVERKNGSNTYFSLMFRDCLSLDYKTMTYDCVFTSPPYYTRETYPHQPDLWRSKHDWNEFFYRPFVTKTYDGLAENGIYALNVNQEIYQFISTILGEATEVVPLRKGDCFRDNNYSEFIYIWIKPPNVEILDVIEFSSDAILETDGGSNLDERQFPICALSDSI
jgi:hypothetical protein